MKFLNFLRFPINYINPKDTLLNVYSMYVERLFNVLSLQIERRFNKDYLIFIKYCSLYKEERPKKEKK